MSKDAFRETGRALRLVSQKIDSSNEERSLVEKDLDRRLRSVEEKADTVDFGPLAEIQRLLVEGTAPELIKSVESVADYLNSASDQASLDQLDGRKALSEGLKGLISAIAQKDFAGPASEIKAAIEGFSVDISDLLQALDRNSSVIEAQTAAQAEIGAQIVAAITSPMEIEFDADGNPKTRRVVN